WDDVRVCEDGALGDGVRVASAQAEGKPVANSVSDGVTVACDDEPVLVFTDDLLELALSLSFGAASGALEDPPSVRAVSDRDRCHPPFPGVVPRKTAVAAAPASWHQAASASRSSSAMYSFIADAGISRVRPWVTDRRRPERICS